MNKCIKNPETRTHKGFKFKIKDDNYVARK